MRATQSSSEYTEVAELREGELVATITERKSTGHFAFRIAKEFKVRGEVKQSSFLSEHHLDSAKRLLAKIEDYFAS